MLEYATDIEHGYCVPRYVPEYTNWLNSSEYAVSLNGCVRPSLFLQFDQAVREWFVTHPQVFEDIPNFTLSFKLDWVAALFERHVSRFGRILALRPAAAAAAVGGASGGFWRPSGAAGMPGRNPAQWNRSQNGPSGAGYTGFAGGPRFNHAGNGGPAHAAPIVCYSFRDNFGHCPRGNECRFRAH